MAGHETDAAGLALPPSHGRTAHHRHGATRARGIALVHYATSSSSSSNGAGTAGRRNDSTTRGNTTTHSGGNTTQHTGSSSGARSSATSSSRSSAGRGGRRGPTDPTAIPREPGKLASCRYIPPNDVRRAWQDSHAWVHAKACRQPAATAIAQAVSERPFARYTDFLAGRPWTDRVDYAGPKTTAIHAAGGFALIGQDGHDVTVQPGETQEVEDLLGPHTPLRQRWDSRGHVLRPAVIC